MSDISPALEDLEVTNLEVPLSDNKRNPIADIATAIETILSEEHLDQKTNITYENELGLIGIDVLQAHMLKSFKYQFPSLTAIKISKQEHVVSVGGYRSNQIVEIFKSIQTNIISGDGISGNRLLGRR